MNEPSRLWEHMDETHNLALTISEENDIRHAADHGREMQLTEAENALSDALFALRGLVEWGREHISPVHDPEGHTALVSAYETLKRLDPMYDALGG
jgi:hypothetical protein